MRGVNKAIIVGRIGKDPVLRNLPDGTAVVDFSVATSEKWKDKKTGEMKEQTEWHRVGAFGKTAEIVGQYAKKGDPIYVEGKIRTRQYDKDGQTRYVTEIKADSVELLPTGKSGGGGQEQRAPAAAAAEAADDFADEIPF